MSFRSAGGGEKSFLHISFERFLTPSEIRNDKLFHKNYSFIVSLGLRKSNFCGRVFLLMNDTQAIKDKIDIVDFIGEYVQLKPAGVSHKGLCPFHREKSPSFMVNRERQSWHCFGCSKGGDIFSFLQEIENMEFVEALRFLAQRAGIVLDTFKTDIDKSQKNRVKDVNKEAARFFRNFLIQIPASQKAVEYLNTRGLQAQTQEEWGVGFIAEQWDLLTKYMIKKGFSIDDLVASGLTIKRDGADASSGRGFYDRFRGRIMFPIWDIYGDVVGFTGRVLVETEHSGGKYVNTPQTLVYDKSRVVFGLNKAKQEIKSHDRIVVVEGQMDVIACHQAGMKYVVATSGTAFTQEQIALLKRYSTNMYIAFDADAAGQSAAKRGIDLALAAGMRVKIIRIPEGAGKDPDECLKKNPQVWFDSVEKARDVMEWYFESAFQGVNIQEPRVRQQVAETLVQEILKISYPIERDFWLHELSARLGVSMEVLREQMQVTRQKQTPVRAQNFGKNQAESSVTAPHSAPLTRMDQLLERFLILVFRFPKILQNQSFFLDETPIQASRFFPLYQTIKNMYTRSQVLDISVLREHLTAHNLDQFSEILFLKGEREFFDYKETDALLELQQIQDQVNLQAKKEKRQGLQEQMFRAEKSGDTERLDQLMKELQEV